MICLIDDTSTVKYMLLILLFQGHDEARVVHLQQSLVPYAR